MDWVLAHRVEIALAVAVSSGLMTVVNFFVRVEPPRRVTQRVAGLILVAVTLASVAFAFMPLVTPTLGPQVSQVAPPDMGNVQPTSQYDSATTNPAAMPIGQADVRANVSPAQPTPTPVALSISGDASNGVRFPISREGVYRITVTGGAYSPWPDDSTRQGQWRTLLDVYLDNVSWAVTSYGSGPKGYTPSVDARVGLVGCDTDWNDKARATSCGPRSAPFERRLDSGHELILMPVDSQGQYIGNREQVSVLITYVEP
jgi:hypothetical protein